MSSTIWRAPSSRSSSTNPDPSSEDRWVEMALQQNLSLVSSRLAADIARENVSAARGGHLPSLDLVASRYRATSDGQYTNADGTPYGSTSLDQYQNIVGLQFTFPLYSGGMVSSQVRQAVYQHRAAKERLERVARQTEHDARDAYLGVLSEISHVKALRRALESNATALNATESGYEAGTRTAVDVLESRRRWIQAQTDYSRSRYDYMINVLKLQQAAGILSEQSLNRLNSLLNDSPRPAAPPAERAASNGSMRREQPRDAAAVQFDELPSAGAQLAASSAGSAKNSTQYVGQRRRIGDFHGAAAAHQQSRDFLAVGIIRSRDHRHAERGRLEQIVPADRHQTSADERHIGGGVERARVRPRCRPTALRASGRTALPVLRRSNRIPPPRQQVRHALEPLRMARHQHQQHIGQAALQRRVRVQQLLLFSAMGTARNPHRAARRRSAGATGAPVRRGSRRAAGRISRCR